MPSSLSTTQAVRYWQTARFELNLAKPLVMGIALHPYLVGQPYRLRHLRRALQHVAAARDRGEVWVTTPGAMPGVGDTSGKAAGPGAPSTASVVSAFCPR